MRCCDRREQYGRAFGVSQARAAYTLLSDVNYFHFSIFFNYSRANFDSNWRGRKPARRACGCHRAEWYERRCERREGNGRGELRHDKTPNNNYHPALLIRYFLSFFLFLFCKKLFLFTTGRPNSFSNSFLAFPATRPPLFASFFNFTIPAEFSVR